MADVWFGTPSQDAFCRAYAVNCDPLAAASEAYPDANRESQRRTARRLLRSESMLARIAELRGEAPGVWLKRAVPRKARVKPTRRVEEGVRVEEIVAVAFDPKQPDIVRLAALRRLDAALADLAKQEPAPGSDQVQISLTVVLPSSRG